MQGKGDRKGESVMAKKDEVRILSIERTGGITKLKVWLPQDLYDGLKEVAERKHQTISEVVAEAISACSEEVKADAKTT